MKPDFPAQQRKNLREMCMSLRRLLASEQPTGMFAILQDVGSIECDALAASGIEFRAARLSLQNLLGRLRDQGVITPERWEEFFDQVE